jgi:hypothetical protein
VDFEVFELLQRADGELEAMIWCDKRKTFALKMDAESGLPDEREVSDNDDFFTPPFPERPK